MNSRSRRLLAGAPLLVATAFATLMPVGSAAATPTASRQVTGQASMECQGYAKGIPPERVTMALQYALKVPSSVQPGQQVSIGGTAALQYSESARQRGKALGVSSVETISTDLSLVVTIGRERKVLFSPRWETGQSAVGNPMIVDGPITFPPFTVPADASGPIKLQLPQNNTVPTPVPNGDPAKVAFSYSSTYYGGPLNNTSGKGGCYHPKTNPEPFASIPVSAASTSPAAAGGTRPPSSTQAGVAAISTGQAPAAATGVPGSDAPGAETQAGPAPAGTAAAEAAGAGGSVDAGAPVVNGPGQAAGTVTPQVYPAPDDADGVHVPTAALVLGAVLICVSSLGYGAFATYRLNSIRKAVGS